MNTDKHFGKKRGGCPPPSPEESKGQTKRRQWSPHRALGVGDLFVEGFLRVSDPHHGRLELPGHLQGEGGGSAVNAAPSGVRAPPQLPGSQGQLSGAGPRGLRCTCAAVPLLHRGMGRQGLILLEVFTFCSATRSTDSVWLEISNGFTLQMVLCCERIAAGGGAEPHAYAGSLIVRKAVSAPGPLGCHVFLSVRLCLCDPGAPPGRAGLCDGAGPYRGPTNNCHTPNNPFRAPP